MGKIQILTKEQKIILDDIGKDNFLASQFYLTGGTALSAFYLQHRYSEDLDFFTEEEFNTQEVLAVINALSKQRKFSFTSEFHTVVYIFMIKFKNKDPLKVDFGYYPYKRLEESRIIEGVKLDSLTDIAVNKLLTVTQRTEVKDFVDLYFLLQKFSLWDLREGVRIKFRMKLEPFIISSDFLKVDDFNSMPRMIKSLTLDELKSFFREKAKEMGAKAVE